LHLNYNLFYFATSEKEMFTEWPFYYVEHARRDAVIGIEEYHD